MLKTKLQTWREKISTVSWYKKNLPATKLWRASWQTAFMSRAQKWSASVRRTLRSDKHRALLLTVLLIFAMNLWGWEKGKIFLYCFLCFLLLRNLRRHVIYQLAILALAIIPFWLLLFAAGIFEGEILARETGNLAFVFLLMGFMKTFKELRNKSEN